MLRLYMRNRRTRKVRRYTCADDLTFEDCELAILRQAVDYNEAHEKKAHANQPEVTRMIEIVEQFLVATKCVCYGGIAINNILPTDAQFYDHNIEIPDYDFYSPTPVKHAKELADIFVKEGYQDVESRSGVHFGTYKVFVNFIPMADITDLHIDIFKTIQKEAIERNGVLYAPANFLRMSMYLELSRPKGDVSRWEKVMKRLTLLNRYYPLTANKCRQIDFQRTMDKNQNLSEQLYYSIRDSLIDQNAVFFGGYASLLYSRYMPTRERKLVESIPDFDVLSENPDECAEYVKTNILALNIRQKVSIVKHEAIGEIIPEYSEILIGKTDTLVCIYKPIACHNYNKLFMKSGKIIRVATIDCMLSFFLAFLYSNHDTKNERLLCMSQFLFDVEEKNRLAQKGLLKRFSMNCYGTQETLETLRAKKTEMYKTLKKNRDSEEYEKWFMKYNPTLKTNTKTKTKTKKKKSWFGNLF